MEDAFDPNVVAEYERDTWSRCAAEYADTFAGITAETVPMLMETAAIRSGTLVLDIGSGPGHVANSVVQFGANVIGVDFSPRMVEVAQSKYPDIEFQRADAEHLPFDSEKFDAVIANFVVHHLARPAKVFSEVSRVLKPGGRFAFAVWGAPEEQSSIGAFFGAVMAHHDLEALPHGPLFGVTDCAVYEPLLRQAELQDCELFTREVAWRSESLDPILKGFWDWGDMARLPAEMQLKIEESTRENAKPFLHDGWYSFPHSILFGSATKG